MYVSRRTLYRFWAVIRGSNESLGSSLGGAGDGRVSTGLWEDDGARTLMLSALLSTSNDNGGRPFNGGSLLLYALDDRIRKSMDRSNVDKKTRWINVQIQ